MPSNPINGAIISAFRASSTEVVQRFCRTFSRGCGIRKPWFRAWTLSWYVELPGGKQVSLGRDERFAVAPKQKPKEPPRAIREAWEALIRTGADTTKLLFSDLVEKHARATTEYSPATREVTRVLLDGFMRSVGPIRVAKLRPHHVTDYIRTKAWSKSYQRLCIAKIEAVINHALAEGWIDENPLKKGEKRIRKPKAERRTIIVTTDEQRRIEAAAVPQFRDFLVGLRESGCRPGELAAARIEDCDLEAGILLVRNKTARTTGVTMRKVWLSPTLRALLTRLVGDRTSGPIWRNCEGGAWTSNTLVKRMFVLRESLGLRKGITLYGYRHRWGSDAINAKGINPALVALQMGHKDLNMLLKHYLHEDDEAMRQAVERASEESRSIVSRFPRSESPSSRAGPLQPDHLVARSTRTTNVADDLRPARFASHCKSLRLRLALVDGVVRRPPVPVRAEKPTASSDPELKVGP